MNRYLSPPKIYKIMSLNLKVQGLTQILHVIVRTAQNVISNNLVVGQIFFPHNRLVLELISPIIFEKLSNPRPCFGTQREGLQGVYNLRWGWGRV